jgi:hypothetical protein
MTHEASPCLLALAVASLLASEEEVWMGAQRYEGVDAMLHRYAELRGVLGTARVTWPDPDRQRDGHPARDAGTRLVIELADIARCITLARLQRIERLVLHHLTRDRRRWCRRCQRSYEADTPECPTCHANRAHGWTYEPFPTLAVLVDELNRAHPALADGRWTMYRVYSTRERAYGRIERVMRRRRMLV